MKYRNSSVWLACAQWIVISTCQLRSVIPQRCISCVEQPEMATHAISTNLPAQTKPIRQHDTRPALLCPQPISNSATLKLTHHMRNRGNRQNNWMKQYLHTEQKDCPCIAWAKHTYKETHYPNLDGHCEIKAKSSMRCTILARDWCCGHQIILDSMHLP